ncbi:hypothetical protein PCK1_003040 [Pneumocystis canis]|nr:hypothetical protein PCK1_003040 [Pneumocystis canis]
MNSKLWIKIYTKIFNFSNKNIYFNNLYYTLFIFNTEYYLYYMINALIEFILMILRNIFRKRGNYVSTKNSAFFARKNSQKVQGQVIGIDLGKILLKILWDLFKTYGY